MSAAKSAGTSREDEVRYRVDPSIWDLPQFAATPFDQLVTDYLTWLRTRTERGGPVVTSDDQGRWGHAQELSKSPGN